MHPSLSKYLKQNIYVKAYRPYVPDFVVAHALGITVVQSNRLGLHYRKISDSDPQLTLRFSKKLFDSLVATCIMQAHELFDKYRPVLCSPLVVLLIANQIKNEVTGDLRVFAKSKGLKRSFIYLYNEQIIEELLLHPNYHVRFLADLLHQCLPYYKTLPKEYLIFKV
jgi:hypothetical protein